MIAQFPYLYRDRRPPALVMLADPMPPTRSRVPKDAGVDWHDRERKSVVWAERTFERPREGLVGRL